MLEYLRSTPPLRATLSLRSIFAPKTAPSVSTAVMIDGKNGLLGGTGYVIYVNWGGVTVARKF